MNPFFLCESSFVGASSFFSATVCQRIWQTGHANRMPIRTKNAPRTNIFVRWRSRSEKVAENYHKHFTQSPFLPLEDIFASHNKIKNVNNKGRKERIALNNTIENIMTKQVATVTPNQTVQEAAQLMSQHNVGAIPVVENGQVKGILTDRDIALRSTAQGLNSSTSVSQVMSSNVITGTPNMSVDEAAKMMSKNQIRRLPIVQNNQLCGIVALGDIATNNAYDQQAEQALSNISEPSQPNA
jgi:CBS domain-containing protein